MLIIGSEAMRFYGLTNRQPKDMDVICTYEEYEKLISWCGGPNGDNVIAHYPLSSKKFVIKHKTGRGIIECEIAWPGSVAEELLQIVKENNLAHRYGDVWIAFPEVQLTLKESHKYLKNNPHFLKTMKDIRYLRRRYEVPECLKEWLVKREAETYDYAHPKLKQNKENFFDTKGVVYKYDHDSIHVAVATGDRPAYLEFKPEDEEVWCSKEMWDQCSEETKLAAVYEESCVLALERCLVPNEFSKATPDIAFRMALEKVCTSITSGWFREYAWENYFKVLAIHDRDHGAYVDKFLSGLEKGIIKEA